MLRFLRVTHLAVIDSVEVEFEAGLNVLTGETGAGKSILVGAVGLLLGGRASGDLVRTGEEMATIEAIFESGGREILVRREVTAQGRSRAFIDGALATAGSLKELSTHLIELHGQHEHQTLLDPGTHQRVLDAYGQLEPLMRPVRDRFDAVRTSAEALSQFRRALADRVARIDLLTFQLNELDKATLSSPRAGEPNEETELGALRQVLANAERVGRLCEESYAALYDDDSAVLTGLGHVWRRVSELAKLDSRFQPYVDAREGIKSQLEDLAGFIRRYADTIDASPSRLQYVEERLALLDRLKRKYGPSLTDVIAYRDSCRAELRELQQGDDRLAELERQHSAAREQYLAAAQALSQARRRAAAKFASELQLSLADLALERTQFDARFSPAAPAAPGDGLESSWTAEGTDVVEFYVSTNPGEELRPLARVVSGGELSRIMLAIKTLMFRARLEAQDIAGQPGQGAPGLVFDEVDAGIGGRVADVVGRKLQALASAFQVLCITHLPQIAAYADAHVQIEKRVADGRTTTTVRRLDHDGRVAELARMLGGASISEGLRASAREMLAGRARGTRSGIDATGATAGEAKEKGESERAKAKGPSPRTKRRTAGTRAS
ncbi:MAG TPA: DNA repair protein RecN [Vicinamibacterales bacterium]|nr:DNA repair protein RecN [Vicinamibacterales bacterium]